MSEETTKLERDNTMVATAKEGEAFLEAKGKVNEDAKTRGQQKEIEEIKDEGADEEKNMKRTTTMEETAKEGKELLDGEDLAKTRGQTEAEKNGKEVTDGPQENGKDKEEDKAEENEDKEDTANGDEKAEADEDDDEKAAIKRTRTMDETVKEGEEFLKKQKLDADSAEKEVAAS